MRFTANDQYTTSFAYLVYFQVSCHDLNRGKFWKANVTESMLCCSVGEQQPFPIFTAAFEIQPTFPSKSKKKSFPKKRFSQQIYNVFRVLNLFAVLHFSPLLYLFFRVALLFFFATW